MERRPGRERVPWSRTAPLSRARRSVPGLGAAADAYAPWVGDRRSRHRRACGSRRNESPPDRGDIATPKALSDIEDELSAPTDRVDHRELGRRPSTVWTRRSPPSRRPTTTGPGSTLYNTAYLDGAAATLAELADRASRLTRAATGTRSAGRSGSAAEDLAAAEAAITLLRENRDRHGYTHEDAATARALRNVLDAAQVWDEVTAAAPAPTTSRGRWRRTCARTGSAPARVGRHRHPGRRVRRRHHHRATQRPRRQRSG